MLYTCKIYIKCQLMPCTYITVSSRLYASILNIFIIAICVFEAVINILVTMFSYNVFFYDVFFLLFFQTHDCGFYFARLYYCIGNLGALFLRCFLCADLNVVRINIIPACVYLCTAGNIGVLFVHENIGIYECFLYIFHCTK